MQIYGHRHIHPHLRVCVKADECGWMYARMSVSACTHTKDIQGHQPRAVVPRQIHALMLTYKEAGTCYDTLILYCAMQVMKGTSPAPWSSAIFAKPLRCRK